MTPAEKLAKLDALLQKYPKYAKPKPKPARLVVASGEVIAPAEVEVSPRDPNWRDGPRPGYVVVNLEAATRMWEAERAQAQWDRAQRADLAPWLWGSR